MLKSRPDICPGPPGLPLSFCVQPCWPLSHPAYAARKIDRKAVVTRHNPEIREGNLRGPMQVGNGEFAFGFDTAVCRPFRTMQYDVELGLVPFPAAAGAAP